MIAFATDATRMGGAMGIEGCRHIVDAIDSRGPRAGAGHRAVALRRRPAGRGRRSRWTRSAQVFAAMVRASGGVPQISVVLGPAAGGAAYGPALTDIVIMSRAGRIFVTGPEVVRSVTGEQVDMERLGGPEPHGRRSGVVHMVADHRGGRARRRPAGSRCCSATGRGRRRPGRRVRTDADLGALLPERAQPRLRRAAAGRRAARRAAASSCTPSGRRTSSPRSAGSAGRTVGVIANNPLRLGGCLDAASAEKAARFVRMCDAFGVPLVVLVDVPGYLPGVGQEWDGVVRRGAKLLHAFAEAVVPRVTLVTRKAYGGAYIAMNSRVAGRDRGVRLAGRRGRGDGRERGGRHPAPAQARRGRRTRARGAARPAGRGARAGGRRRGTGPWSSAWSTRSSSPPRPGADRRGPGGRPAGAGPARQHPALTAWFREIAAWEITCGLTTGLLTRAS